MRKYSRKKKKNKDTDVAYYLHVIYSPCGAIDLWLEETTQRRLEGMASSGSGRNKLVAASQVRCGAMI
jgi:hypothetical protein